MAKGSGGAGRSTGRATDGGSRSGGGISVGFAPGEDISAFAVPASARAYRSPAPTTPKQKTDKYAAVQKDRLKKAGTAYNLAQNNTLPKLLAKRASATSARQIATIDRAIAMRADAMRKR